MQATNVSRTLKQGPFICVLLVLCSFYYFMVIHKDDSNVIIEPVVQCRVEKKPAEKNFISSQCKCAKIIPVASESLLNDTGRFQWCGMESGLRGEHQRVVTYALFGDAQNATFYKRYYGLMKNISLTIEKEYPGWVMRFYHSFTENERDGFQALCDIYCRFPHVDLCSVKDLWERIGENNTLPIDPKILKGLNRRMYRYLVMMDPNVDVFVSRDIDSLIFKREVDAVNEWLQSNYTFHLMRDNTYHGSLILAGNSNIRSSLSPHSLRFHLCCFV